MKDIVITPRRQKAELLWLLAAFMVANVCNLWAIISYDAPLSELWSSLCYVLVFTVVLYVACVVLRLLWHGIVATLWRKLKPKKSTKNSI
jgi:uncharacterized membrane protein YczE